MDFADSPDEAAFRARLRAWLRDNNPGLPTSSTSDDYWDGQARWHQSLYDGGFFGMSWPKDVGGQDLPTIYEVDPRRGARRRRCPPRPSLGYLVQGILEHGNDDIRRRFLPGHRQRPRPLVPGLQRARRRLRPRVAAHPRRARW